MNGILKLNRFTTIPFLIDLLERKKLVLLNPSLWEDFNDRETIEAYRKNIKAQSIYVLCMTYKNQTIHHWNAFAKGESGCCIEFSPTRLFEVLKKNKNCKHDKTTYVRINDIAKYSPKTPKLPFLKRDPFSPESEYRVLITSDKKQEITSELDIDLSMIRKITLSNKLSATVFNSIKAVLQERTKGSGIKIYRSTLYNNQKWINHFKAESDRRN